jgi:preprotein translocase subunit Sec61beta
MHQAAARRKGAAMSPGIVIMVACFAVAIMLSLLNCGR